MTEHALDITYLSFLSKIKAKDEIGLTMKQ